MKRILSLVLCVSMLFAFCFAHAELEVPQPEPTDDELMASFVGKLFMLLPTMMNLDKNALRLEVSQADQQVLEAMLQQLDGVFDLSTNVAGAPVEAQFTEDAILVCMGEQVLKLPYESISTLSSNFTSSAAGTNIDPMLIYQLFTDFYNSAILPSLTTESDENGQRFVFDLTQERLTESLLALGDSAAENEEFLKMLETFEISDFPAMWSELRGVLESGFLQVSLRAEGSIEGDASKLDVDGMFMGVPLKLTAAADAQDADFNLSIGDFVNLNGKASGVDGGYDFHFTGPDDFAYDVAFVPADDGWTYDVVMTQSGSTIYTVNAAMTEAAFDAGLTCLVSEDDEPLSATLHFDKATAALAANVTCPEAMGGLSVDIAGDATETGYHISAIVSQGGEPIATADIVYTDTDELFGLEAAVSMAGDEPVEMASASFAFAKQTGAFKLRYDDANGNFADAHGVMTAEQHTCILDTGEDGNVRSRMDLDILSNDTEYVYSFTYYQDSYYRGSLDRVSNIFFSLDKETGAFVGNYTTTSDRYEFQGVCTDGLLNFHCDGFEYGHGAGMLDVSAHWDDIGLTAEYTWSNGYDVYAGTLIWSDALKSMSLNGDNLRFYAAMQHNRNGLPRTFRILASDGRYSTFEFSVDNKILLNINGRTTEISLEMKDENTLCMKAITSEGYGIANTVDVDFIVQDKQFSVVATDDEGNELFRAVLEAVEKTEFAPLDDGENVIEITPDLVSSILEIFMGGSEEDAQAEPADSAEEAAPAA